MMSAATTTITSSTPISKRASTLRSLQKGLLRNILNYGIMESCPENPASHAGFEPSAWKVLILDAVAQKVMSPVLKVNDLRENGVTLYLQLHSNRQPIVDIPAIYFVEPTAENVSRICQDLKERLYGSVYLNFTSVLSRSLLEDLAYHVVQTNTADTIVKVYDQYLNYVCLEENFFSLAMSKVYSILHGTSSSEALIESTIDGVASSLFSVLLTFGGVPPIIISVKGTAGEMVAVKLDTKIRNHLVNTKSSVLGTFEGGEDGGILQRPILALLDRSFDLTWPLRHSSTYNALIHDILDMKLNRITITKSTDRGGVEQKTFDIDSNDTFWSTNAALPFPTVAENVDTAVSNYKADRDQITRTTGFSGGILESSGSGNNSNLGTGELIKEGSGNFTADELKVAISLVPELTARKRMIDMHLDLSSALLDQIKSRDLGDYFLLEQQIGTSEGNKSAILELLQRKQGTAMDKLRLFLVYYLIMPDLSKGELEEFERALNDAKCDMTAVEYIKKVKAFNKMSQMSLGGLLNKSTASQSMGMGGSSPLGGGGNTTADFLDRFKFGGLKEASAGISGMLGNLVSSVRNLLPESADSPITKQIDLMLEQMIFGPGSGRSTSGPTSSSMEQYILHDPKRSSGGSGGPLPKSPAAYNHLMVFVVGGTNYSEYNSLTDYVKKKQLKMPVTFGSTDILNGSDFVAQLGHLSQ